MGKKLHEFFQIPPEVRSTGRPAKSTSSKDLFLDDLMSGDYTHLVIFSGNKLHRPNFRSLRDRHNSLRYQRVHKITSDLFNQIFRWSKQTQFGDRKKYSDGTVAHQVWHYYPDIAGVSNVAHWYVLYPHWVDANGEVIAQGDDGKKYQLTPIGESTTSAGIAVAPGLVGNGDSRTRHCPNCGKWYDKEYRSCPFCTRTESNRGFIQKFTPTPAVQELINAGKY